MELYPSQLFFSYRKVDMCDCNKYSRTRVSEDRCVRVERKCVRPSCHPSWDCTPCPPSPPGPQCPCGLFDCKKIEHNICPQIVFKIDQLRAVLESGVPFTGLELALSNDVVLKFQYTFPAIPTFTNPAYGIDAVRKDLIVLSGGGTKNIKSNRTAILQEDCYSYLTTGEFVLTPKTGPATPTVIKNIIRFVFTCENGELKIRLLEVFGDFTPLLVA